MTGRLTSRASWLLASLVALTGAVGAILIPHDTAPVVQPAADAACSSCDARHAHLSELRSAAAKGTE